MEMLRAEPWCYYPLTLQFLSSTHAALRGRCPPPPEHMRVLVAPLEVGAASCQPTPKGLAVRSPAARQIDSAACLRLVERLVQATFSS